MRKPDPPLDAEPVRPEESFLQRFHRRKLEARGLTVAPETPTPSGPELKDAGEDTSPHEPPPELTDTDMPPLDSLTEESDYTGFLSDKVSESLRRAALRKLFHSSAFNVIDELDDYAEDFTTFEALGDLVTAEMRHRLDIEARRQAERRQQDVAEPVSSDTSDPADPDDPLPTTLDEQVEPQDPQPATLAADPEAAGPSTATTPESNTHAERPADT